MAHKVEIKGNYFYLVIDNSTIYKRSKSKIEIVNSAVSDETYDIIYDGNDVFVDDINWSEFVDENDTAFGSQSLFDEWVDSNTGFNAASGGSGADEKSGFIDYNNTIGTISVTANTWTDIPNNGQGAFTNKNYAPDGVTDLMDVSTGYLDFRELDLGDTAFIRNDYIINPNSNRALLELRYVLGSGANQYTLQTSVNRLDSGSGRDYRYSLKVDKIYMGDLNTKDNPVKIQVRLSQDGNLTNAGSVITVLKRG
jgi:hypothetical protein